MKNSNRKAGLMLLKLWWQMIRCIKHYKSTRHVAFLALEKADCLMVVNIVVACRRLSKSL